jgi:SAM-dependent methyltransferase
VTRDFSTRLRVYDVQLDLGFMERRAQILKELHAIFRQPLEEECDALQGLPWLHAPARMLIPGELLSGGKYSRLPRVYASVSTIARRSKRLARDTRNSVFALWLWGRQYEDPICGHTFRRMMDTPWSGRPNARCPKCNSLERHRVEWLYLLRELAIGNRGLRVLHVAPEPGLRFRLNKLPSLEYVTTDLLDPSVDIRADLASLPIPSGTFDLVICNHVLEHVADDVAAARELVRVLAPGGRAVMQHPIDWSRPVTFEDPSIETPEARDAAYFQSDHRRLYGSDFRDRLASGGFSHVVDVPYREQLPAEERRRYRLDPLPSPRPSRDLDLDRIVEATP